MVRISKRFFKTRVKTMITRIIIKEIEKTMTIQSGMKVKNHNLGLVSTYYLYLALITYFVVLAIFNSFFPAHPYLSLYYRKELYFFTRMKSEYNLSLLKTL